MKYILACLGLMFGVLATSSAKAQTCSISGSDMSAFSALDYDAFNYGPDGWRKLSSQKCYYDAGASIVSWLIDHESELSSPEQRSQHYQAARNFALANNKEIALLQLRMAQDQSDARLGEMNWNAYLDAFAAWLTSDQDALGAAIMRLENQTIGADGRKPNLDAAKRFERCFTRSYIEIEQDLSCLAAPVAGAGQ